eukprot:jgi/Astpho2/3869/Aster-04380
MDQKLSRKLVHITAGPLLVLTWPLFSWADSARWWAALTPALNMARLLLAGTGVTDDAGTVRAVTREGDRKELLRGPLYYCIILIGITLGFWRHHPAGFAAIALMCGGDGLADIAGRRFGRAKLPWNRNKSWVGSLAMFAGGWVMAYLMLALFASLGFFMITVRAAIVAITSMCLASTVVESLPVNQWLDDNLSVPVAAILVGILLIRLHV